jgi:hypothetical protein
VILPCRADVCALKRDWDSMGAPARACRRVGTKSLRSIKLTVKIVISGSSWGGSVNR